MNGIEPLKANPSWEMSQDVRDFIEGNEATFVDHHKGALVEARGIEVSDEVLEWYMTLGPVKAREIGVVYPSVARLLAARLDPRSRGGLNSLGGTALKTKELSTGPEVDAYDFSTMFNANGKYGCFDGDTNWGLSLMADTAYKPQNDATFAKLRAEGFKIEKGSIKSTQWFIAHNDKNVVVSFRGTEPEPGKQNVMDILKDANWLFPRKFLGKGRAHPGFVDAIKETYLPIAKQLLTIAKDRKRTQSGVKDAKIENAEEMKQYIGEIFYTGHSLGAALAALMAVALEIELDLVGDVYVDGMPRAMNRDLAAYYNECGLGARTFRKVNNCDGVTQIPPFGYGFKYRHVGALIYIREDGQPRVGASYEEMKADITAALKDGYRGPDLLEPLSDHAMAAYLKTGPRLRDLEVSPMQYAASAVEELSAKHPFRPWVTDDDVTDAISLFDPRLGADKLEEISVLLSSGTRTKLMRWAEQISMTDRLPRIS